MIIKGIGTHLKVKNFEKSRAFYKALGFKKVFEYGPNIPFRKDKSGNLLSAPEEYSGIVFEPGGCKLEIAAGHRAVKPQVFQEKIPSSKVSLMVYVPSLNNLIKSAKKANIPIAVAPRHYYWGTLEVVIKDPDGLVLVFIAPYSQLEAKKVNADETWGKPAKRD